MSRYLFLRHATTYGIEQHLVQGSSDSSLSPRGIREAEVTAQVLSNEKISSCYTSPLGRAMQTANVLCAPHQLKPVVLNELREMSFGRMEGRTHNYSILKRGSLYLKLRALRFFYLSMFNAEPLGNVRRRAQTAWDFLQSLPSENTLLVITHGILLNSLLRNIFPHQPTIRQGVELHACSINEIISCDDQPQLMRLNDHTHLKDI